jgi:ribosomal-protein-alanine N-acetyltransferase
MDSPAPSASLETSRLLLRPLAATDEDNLFALFNDPDVMRFLGPLIPREKTATILQTALAHWQQRGYGIWAVQDKASGKFVGRLGLRFLDDIGETELLYTLNKEFWGRGLATEAGAAALAFGFGRAGLGRIIALARPDNVGSWRVMEKLGMRRERIAPFRGEESVWYALGRDEYASRPPKEAHGC